MRQDGRYLIKSIFSQNHKRKRNFRENNCNMNNNKTMFRAILGILIIVAFFLPWFKFGGGSGLDLVTTSNANESTATTVIRYSFLLIPFFALVVLIRSVNKQSSGFLLRLLPFLVTAILTTLFIIGVNVSGGAAGELKGWLQLIDYGFYITAIASFVLVLV